MSALSIARRYALALSESARDQDRTDRVDEDVVFVRESLDSSPDLERFFESPIVSRGKKASVVEALFEERIDRLSLDFLLLLVDKRREQMLRRVLAEYLNLRDRQQGLVSVLARSARPMGTGEETKLRDSLARMTGKNVRLRSEVDGSILGGMVIRVGDTVFDGSVTNKLAALKERLISTR